MNNIRRTNNHQLTKSYYEPYNVCKINSKANYIDNSYLELFENKINSKLDNILKEMEGMKEIKMKLNNIQNLLSNFGKIINNVNSLVGSVKKIIEDINNISRKTKMQTNDEVKKKEKGFNSNEKIFIDGSKICVKEPKFSDFIVLKKKNDDKINYYEPYEIENEREKIIESIKNYVDEYYLKDKENILNETAGNFLYSVGGISRKALSLANNIYSELFNEYKKYLKNNKEWLKLNHNEDRRNLSIWVKNYLDEQKFFEYYSDLNLKEIEPYLYQKDEKTNNILKGLFKDLIKIQTKCLLSIPPVKAQFTNNNCKFENNIMFDIIFKGKKKLVNFCYLPGLISNGQLIKGGKFYVFTFIEGKSYQKKENIFDNEIASQNPILYSFPNNLHSLQLKIEKKLKQNNDFYEIKFITEPLICSELKPCYSLKRIEKGKSIEDKNDSGIFLIEKNYIRDKYSLKISDCLNRNKVFDDLKLYNK